MASEALALVRRNALAALRPPPRVRLSEWIEANVRLPEGSGALPGPIRLHPYQREIADAIGDPDIERVTLLKAVRVGFTTLLTSAIGSFAINDPAPVLVLLPTDDDARRFVVDDVEPIFEASPALADVLSDDQEHGGRNTVRARRYAGGSLRVVAAKSPRNLRAHTVRVLFIDEADAMFPGNEGNPIVLAENRTLSFPNRKIVLGSTPNIAETSNVMRAWEASDQRIYEVPCPACGAFTEILWRHIEWETDRPETAAFRCPHCSALVPERFKGEMVAAGHFRATRPDVQGHAGFRVNTLVSSLPNAKWSDLAAAFLAAKDRPELLQPFVNTFLAEPWDGGGDGVDEHAVAGRVEPFGLDAIPEEVLAVTAGVDVQDDRLEVTFAGHAADGCIFVLGHVIVWGSPDDDITWQELDALLASRWPHPLGGRLRCDAALIDSGDGDHTARVYRFAFPRASRRIMAGKGMPGARPIIAASKSKVQGGRLFIVGVDGCKATLAARIDRATGIRFSASLEAVYFEQLASERRVTRYHMGQPVSRWERIPGRRAEALDCLVYAFAARTTFHLNPETRLAELRGEPAAPSAPRVRPSAYMKKWSIPR